MKSRRYILPTVLAALALLALFSSYFTVNEQERGVVTKPAR